MTSLLQKFWRLRPREIFRSGHCFIKFNFFRFFGLKILRYIFYSVSHILCAIVLRLFSSLMARSINLRNLFSPYPSNIVENDLSQNVINNDVMSERNTCVRSYETSRFTHKDAYCKTRQVCLQMNKQRHLLEGEPLEVVIKIENIQTTALLARNLYPLWQHLLMRNI